MSDDFPMEGMALTHILVVSDMARSRHFYNDVLGAEIIREYGGSSCVLQFQGAWLLLVTGGDLESVHGDVHGVLRGSSTSR